MRTRILGCVAVALLATCGFADYCHFVKTSPHARLYRGTSKYPLRWRDNTLVRFTDKERRTLDDKLARDAQTSKGESR